MYASTPLLPLYKYGRCFVRSYIHGYLAEAIEPHRRAPATEKIQQFLSLSRCFEFYLFLLASPPRTDSAFTGGGRAKRQTGQTFKWDRRRRTAMGSSSSTEELKARPQGIKKLNDSVWELQRPNGPPEVDVIFFHGLQFSQADLDQADWKTWVSRDGTKVWPKDWLGAQLPNARIWSISYNAIAVKLNDSNDLRLKQISENLLNDIVLDRNHGAGKGCPVVLVGHSLGGIIIKSLLLEGVLQNALVGGSNDRITEFLENCKGVFYYSTPFGGSRLGDWLQRLQFKNEPLVKLLTVLNAETAEINENIRKYGKMKSFLILESRETKYGKFRGQVVVEGSARNNVDALYTANANHIDVCKPLNDTDGIYRKLEEFIQYTVMEGKLTEKSEDELLL